MFAFAEIEKFYIGKVEVSHEDYCAVDTALIRVRAVRTEGDTVFSALTLSVYARIDTVSSPGHTLVLKRSAKEIAAIEAFLDAQRTRSALMTVGDTVPDFTLPYFKTTETSSVNYRRDLSGRIVVLNFWATWCGPCIEELKPEHIPAIVGQYANRTDFVFLPISVNHNAQELTDFFASPRGASLRWLADATAWDTNSTLLRRFSTGGIPLTVVIDKEGTVCFNESGSILTPEQQSRLQTTLSSLLD